MFTIITVKQLKRAAAILLCALVLLCGGNLLVGRVRATAGEEKSFIKWVDFNVPYEALDKALKLDVASHGTDAPLNWVELLAYLAARETEYTNIRILLMGRAAGLSPEVIRSRLRRTCA